MLESLTYGKVSPSRGARPAGLAWSRPQEARKDYVQRIERKIVLIDGRRLAQLMIEHDVGVATAKAYVVKKLDQDYFEEESG